jgi:hypothetical protein
MSFLIFDVDHSLASIGGVSAAEELCSIKPIQITGGLSEVRDVISKLFRKQHTDYQHPLLTDNIQHTRHKLSTTAEQYKLEGIVIDTISHLFLRDMRLLENKNKAERLDLQDWGKLERTYNQFISTLVQLPVWVVVNSHISYDKNDLGQFLFKPQLKGATKDFIGEYFDCILYTRIRKTNNNTYYLWQTRPDTQRYAKDRLDVLDPIMPQDFSIILSRYREKGIQHPKILVIGESGTGKTRALLTAKFTPAADIPSGNNDKASTEVISNLRKD